MAKYNNLYEQVVFSTDKYKYAKSEEEAAAEMWKDITDFIRILFKNEYNVVMYEEEANIIVIEYEHDERVDFWGCPRPMWVTNDEADEIEAARYCEENTVEE